MADVEYYNGHWTGEEIDKRLVLIGCGTITGTGESVTTTVTNSNIKAKHTVIKALWGNRNAQVGDWNVTTYDGYLTVSGAVNGSTTFTVWLGIAL